MLSQSFSKKIPPVAPPLSAIEISGRYGRDYFWGVSSGYSSDGYPSLSKMWEPWLDLIQEIIPPPATLVDLGAAYGFLTHEAARRGYHAFGAEISRYALCQEESRTEGLAQADLHHLPFSGGFADILTLFDVLEHLEDPLRTLQEARRLLKEGGLLVVTTPDPIFFEPTEATHIFERPPAFWLTALEALGLIPRFRFSNEAFNFQVLATTEGSPLLEKTPIFQHDYFSHQSDFQQRSPSGEGVPLLEMVPRHGWGPLEEGGRSIRSESGTLYLLNRSDRPRRVRLRLKVRHTSRFSTLRIRFNSYVLEEIFLTSEKQEHVVEPGPFLVPSGGHHLFFEVAPGGPEVTVSEITWKAEPAEPDEITEALPYDLFQRYRLASELTRLLQVESLLDIGGYIGDRYGHLATPRDFFSEIPLVQTTDIRQCDHPFHDPADALRQPFPDTSFDLVCTLDVLEHIPQERRMDFLRELDRISAGWIILGAPFYSPEVDSIESLLAQSLKLRFLDEHRSYGLPRDSLITDYFATEQGYEVHRLPNGFLPRWAQMQILTQEIFSVRDHQVIRDFSRLYNRSFYGADQKEPAYRTIFLIAKNPLSTSQARQLAELHRQPPADYTCLDSMVREPEFPGLYAKIVARAQAREKALSDVQFLANARQDLISILQEENGHLLRELNETPLWKLARRRWGRRREE